MDIYSLKDIGSYIAEERANKGYTQEEFAEYLCTSHATLSKLENGIPVSSKLIERALQLLGKKITVVPKGYNE